MPISRRQFIIASGLASGYALLNSALVRADDPTILSTFPAIITVPGNYALDQSHTLNLTHGAAIEIRCDNVHVDLAGFTLSNAAGNSINAVGVFASDRIGVQIKNGTLTGFHSGVYFDGPTHRSAQHLVKDLSIQNFLAAGIVMSGESCVVKHNTLNSSSRSTQVKVLDCAAAIMGIGLNRARGCLVIDNSINLHKASAPWEFTVGVMVGNQSIDSVLLGTSISNVHAGIIFDEIKSALGEVRDTVAINVSRLVTGGVDLGNNA